MPPWAGIAEVDGSRRLAEHQRSGAVHAGQQTGIVARVGRDFRRGDVAGLRDEAGEVAIGDRRGVDPEPVDPHLARSEEHTSELQSLMRISYAVFCLKKKNTPKKSEATIRTKIRRTY